MFSTSRREAVLFPTISPMQNAQEQSMFFSQPDACILTLLSFTVVHACSRSHHCDDNNSSTIDFCIRPHKLCLSVSGHQLDNNTGIRSLDTLINETNAFPLSPNEKYTIVNIVVKVLAQFNSYRSLHLNLYNVVPVQPLLKLNKSISDEQTNSEFQNEMVKTFPVMNDFHTVYFSQDRSLSRSRLCYSLSKGSLKTENGVTLYLILHLALT